MLFILDIILTKTFGDIIEWFILDVSYYSFHFFKKHISLDKVDSFTFMCCAVFKKINQSVRFTLNWFLWKIIPFLMR